MSGSQTSYWVRTFAFMDGLEACTNSDAVGRVIVAELAALGFSTR